MPGSREFDKGMDFLEFKAERSVLVLVLSVIIQGVPKIAKNVDTTLLISSSNYTKCHTYVCSGGDLCSPFFSNFSETPCVKVGFDVKVSFVW